MSASHRIPRETVPSFCTRCSTSFENARALRNHQRHCDFPVSTAAVNENTEMEDAQTEVPFANPAQPAAVNPDTLTGMSADDDAMDTIEEEMMADYNDDVEYGGGDDFEQTHDVPVANSDDNDDDGKQMHPWHRCHLLLTIPDCNLIAIMTTTEEDGSEFDLLDFRYKTVGVVDPDSEDQACLYDCRSLEIVDQITYTKSELISIELYDIVNDYTIPRETYRKLVRLMNNTLEGMEKISQGKCQCNDISVRQQLTILDLAETSPECKACYNASRL